MVVTNTGRRSEVLESLIYVNITESGHDCNSYIAKMAGNSEVLEDSLLFLRNGSFSHLQQFRIFGILSSSVRQRLVPLEVV